MAKKIKDPLPEKEITRFEIGQAPNKDELVLVLSQICRHLLEQRNRSESQTSKEYNEDSNKFIIDDI